MPRHVAIIMDGNGRWARARNLPRVMGHRAGVKAVESVIDGAVRLNLEFLSLFSFSTENWKRPEGEVSALMNLLAEYVDSNLTRLVERDIRVIPLGDIDGLPSYVKSRVRKAERATRTNQGLCLVMALNYGGRAEIAQTAARLAHAACQGELDPRSIDADTFRAYLDLPDLPDPDLIIRTGGEMRLSNFYLWQAAYAELWTTQVFWPDFRTENLEEAIRDFQCRDRRFGGLPEQM